MKKFLSLVLALVMTMSLVTVSAGAADFDDSGDIAYKEAVDVISALGIVDGYSDGTFRPDGSLTRGAAAKIICNLILGPTTASALSASTAPFKDVPTTNTFAGYITYCSQRGIISGYGDGTFRPTGTLSGNAFMKMLLGALGYDSSIEHYTGANWQVNVIKQASGIGLVDGNDSFVGNNPVTRQEAALYAFNMINATMVEYDTKSTISVGDITIDTIPARSDVTNTTSTDGNIDGERNGDGLMQFGERYFKDLEKQDASDMFGRPSTKWVYDREDVGTYAKEADTTYVMEDDSAKVVDILGDNDYMSYRDSDIDSKAEVYFNGDDTATLNSDVKKGDIVEAYEDDDGVVTTVVVRQYTLAKIDEVNEDLSTSEERNGASVELTLVDLDDKDVGNGTYYDDYDDSDDVLAGYNSDYTEGTVLAVALDGTTILDSYIADSVSGSISGYRNSSVTMDGTRYPYAATAKALTSVDFDKDYTIYLTAEGYVLGVEGETGVDVNDVYYVTGTYQGAKSYGKDSYYAQAVSLADGSVSDIKLDVDSNNNAGDLNVASSPGIDFKTDRAGLYTFDDGKAKIYNSAAAVDFTVDDDDALDEALEADAGRIVLDDGSRYYLDANTRFLAVDKYADDIDVSTATGGMRVDDINGDSSNGAVKVFVIADGRDAQYVILANFNATMSSDDVVYIAKANYDTIGKDQYEGDMWFMSTGESETVVLDEKYAVGFYKVSDIDEDGVYSLNSTTPNDDSVVPALKDDVDSGNKKVTSSSEGFDLQVNLPKDTSSSVIYRDALYLNNTDVVYDDVVLANAVVFDARSSNFNYLYARDINSVARLSDALKQGNVIVNLYVVDGEITFIAVTDSAHDNSTVTPGGGGGTTTLDAKLVKGATGSVELWVYNDTGAAVTYTGTVTITNTNSGVVDTVDLAGGSVADNGMSPASAQETIAASSNSAMKYQATVTIGGVKVITNSVIGG